MLLGSALQLPPAARGRRNSPVQADAFGGDTHRHGPIPGQGSMPEAWPPPGLKPCEAPDPTGTRTNDGRCEIKPAEVRVLDNRSSRRCSALCASPCIRTTGVSRHTSEHVYQQSALLYTRFHVATAPAVLCIEYGGVHCTGERTWPLKMTTPHFAGMPQSKMGTCAAPLPTRACACERLRARAHAHPTHTHTGDGACQSSPPELSPAAISVALVRGRGEREHMGSVLPARHVMLCWQLADT
jgi:hypothetical protein